MKLFCERTVLPSPTGGYTILPALICIQDGQITRVETGEEAEEKRSDPDVEDLGNRVLSPAFVNAHTHLAMHALRGIGSLDRMRGNVVEEFFFRVESQVTDADIRAFVRMGAYDALCAGVGTVWDHYYGGLELAAGIRDVGLCAVIAPTLQDVAGPGVDQLEQQLQATADLVSDSSWKDDGIVAALGPHATDTVSDDLWAKVRDLRDQLQIPVHAHVAQSIEEVQRSHALHGCSPVERLHQLGLLSGEQSFLLVHALFLSHQDLDRVGTGPNVLGHCPYSQAQFAFPAPISTWLEQGLSLAVGTDCGACNDGMNVQQELRLIAGGPGLAPTWSPERIAAEASGALGAAEALQAKRVEIYDRAIPQLGHERLLSWVWEGPGQIHADLQVGAIQEGHLANLVLWNLEHPATWPGKDPIRTLVMTDATAAIDQVMIRGTWRGERGSFRASIAQSSDYQAACSEANQRLDALLERI